MRGDDTDRIRQAARQSAKRQLAAEKGREHVGYEVGPMNEVAVATAIRKKLPGKPKPREEVLHNYQQENAERRSRIQQKFGRDADVLWQFWAPDPEEFYRWRVKLDCGCVDELMSRSEDDLPHERRTLDPVNGAWLPAGQVWRVCDHTKPAPKPYRMIAVWEERHEMTFPADPLEPPAYLSSPDLADVWAKIRHEEPRTKAIWRVTLSCGHVDDHVVTHLDWKPDDLPRRMPADSPRLREMTQAWSEYGERELREHNLRMIADGWPLPQTERDCFVCPHARPIIAYEPIGWLVPKSSTPKPPQKPSRQTLERRLARAQAEAEKLRDQLATLDAAEPESPRA